MRPILQKGKIRLAGAVDNSPIGLLDEPELPQHGGTHNVVFFPFMSGIGTTTIVQRLCGSNPASPNPSSGINGYRAVWSIELDTVGTIRYENFFLWDICYETVQKCPDAALSSLQSARVIVLLIPIEKRSLLEGLSNWYRQNITESQRVIICITRCDKVEQAEIRIPSDIDSISQTLNCSAVQISGANLSRSSKELDPTIRNLVFAIANNLPERV